MRASESLERYDERSFAIAPLQNVRTALARDLVAAFISATVAITYALSYGALLFTGSLAERVSDGMTIMLVTAAIGGAVVAASSSFRFAIGGADSNTTAVFAVIGATLAERLHGRPEAAAQHLALELMTGAVITGIIFVVLGRLHLGRWIRFIPYPIVAGFLAATGWLLLNGSLRVIAGVSLPQHLDAALTPSGAARLAVGIGIGAVLYGLRRFKNPLLVPGLLLGATAIADAALARTIGIPAADAESYSAVALR